MCPFAVTLPWEIYHRYVRTQPNKRLAQTVWTEASEWLYPNKRTADATRRKRLEKGNSAANSHHGTHGRGLKGPYFGPSSMN